MPVRNIAKAVDGYVRLFGFRKAFENHEYAILRRDAVELHLWAANGPEGSGAEPRLAGSASCRIQVSDIQAVYREMQAQGVIHPNGALQQHPWGMEFATLDVDGNQITFSQKR